ncbi:M48 family metalloprotease [Methylobrevis albus]|uniref:M48 family metalloprotease n=1 Tax=Methylobrevis albus TaxID=2793297 RepID=A0A931MXU2_9HYPH|nr:M48 family metalloprotease [Methylobrevis albus]MBH0237340.1 M48 family metalloprotease [Methylobrevis albus]
MAMAAMLLVGGCVSSLTGTEPEMPLMPEPVRAEQKADPREVAIAEQEHPKILAAYGGTYNDPAAELAIARAVGRIVAASDEPGRSYRVTILNSPTVNAFALPGGYVYVTRGLLALAVDTSEVAAVIAHEMAHVTARHAFARQERAAAAAVASRVVQDVVQDPAVQRLALASSQLSLARFSQIQELQADEIGIRTLAKAGYDPLAAARFLRTMSAFAVYKTAVPNEPNDVDFLSSHPSTPERLQQAIATAQATGARDGERDREAYLERLDGLMYGDDPEEGFVRGRQFLHAKLGLGFEVPAGYMLENTAKAVLATSPSGTALRFDGADVPRGSDLVQYLQSGWINGLQDGSIRTLSLNGLPAAVASAVTRGYSYRIGVVRFGDATFRFLFATRSPGPAFEAEFESTLRSFRPLTADEQLGLKPLRLQIVTARRGDTAAMFARRMGFMDRPEQLFRVLNGLAPGEEPVAGQRVKLVSES